MMYDNGKKSEGGSCQTTEYSAWNCESSVIIPQQQAAPDFTKQNMHDFHTMSRTMNDECQQMDGFIEAC